MSEAYEIGVTLALGDGVSAHMAQARRDTAQLERVLQAGGVSVQQLRAASVSALSAIRAVPAVEKALTKEAVAAPAKESALAGIRRERAPVVAASPEIVSAVARVEAAPATVPVWPQVSEAATPPRVQATSAVAVPEPQSAAGVLPAVAAPAAAAPLLAAAAAPVAAPMPDQAEQVVQAPQAAPAAVPQSVLQISAPVSLATIGAAARGQRPTPTPSPASLDTDVRPDAARSAEPAFVAAPQAQAAVPGGAVGAAPLAWEQVAASAPAPAGRGDDVFAAERMATSQAPSAPAQERPFAEPQPASEAASSAQAPAAPPPAAASAGPTEGDVYLDGALVGRWISRFLTQAAGRASAGPTGFDPRRGRLLPGATVGG